MTTPAPRHVGRATPEPSGSLDARGEASTRLHGPWLAIARLAWATAALLFVGLFVASLRAYVLQLGTVTDMERVLHMTVPPRFEFAIDVANMLAALAVGLLCFALAAVIFWRTPQQRMPLFVSLFLLGFGLVTTLEPSWPDWNTFILRGRAVLMVLLTLFFYTFPDGRFAPRWTRALALALVPWCLVTFLVPVLHTVPEHPTTSAQLPALALWYLGLPISGLGAQLYRYLRLSNPSERQQTKWAVFGFAAWLLWLLVLATLYTLLIRYTRSAPRSWWPLFILLVRVMAWFGLSIVPLSIGVAVLRYRLYDIDVIINRALVYGTLTAALALMYWGSVVLLQQLFRPLIGQGNALAIVASTLVIAALFQPLRRRIQAGIDRRFYRRKYDSAKTLQVFSAKMRDEVDLDTLTGNLLAVVEETMQPAHVSLWLRDLPTPRQPEG